MTEQRVDGYRLVNIPVQPTISEPLLVPLITFLNALNVVLNDFSQFLSNFMFYVRRSLPKVPTTTHDREGFQTSAPRIPHSDSRNTVSWSHKLYDEKIYTHYS